MGLRLRKEVDTVQASQDKAVKGKALAVSIF